MALKIFVYDTTTKIKRYVAYPGFHDYVETVSGAAKTVFQLDVDITATHKIDILVDGRDQSIEGTHWTRDVDTNRITTTSSVNVGSEFKARIYLY